MLNLKLSYLWQKTVMEIMCLMYLFGLHYGLWVMIKLIIHQLDGHIVQKLMLWNGLPLSHLHGGASGYETQVNNAYHWNGADGLGYTHWSDSNIIIFLTHTLNFINGELISIDMMMVLTQIR